MKKTYIIIFTLFVAALFFVGIAFGATNQINNFIDENEEEENETATEKAIEASGFPVNTPVEPAYPVETTVGPTIPVSTPKASPGFGIIMDIVVILSTIYIFVKRS